MTRPPQRLRPRYGRMAALTGSLVVTVVSVLGGTGVLPAGSADTASAATSPGAIAQVGAVVSGAVPWSERADRTAAGSGSATDVVAPSADTTLPRRSGSGHRVVFSESRQRVWLVAGADDVRRTYPVSGSLYDNLDPGTYEVYSRSEQAWGIDDSGTMKYFVRFAHGDNAAIGFHDIPVDDGDPVQSFDELGTPQSHGCIRQRRSDARALWRFAPLGTTVVVTR